MKPLYFCLLAFFGIMSSTAAQTSADSLIAQVRLRFAPDKRTAHFDIKASAAEGQHWLLEGETNLPEAKKYLLETFVKAHLTYTDQIKILPEDGGLQGAYWAVVPLSACNIRSQPRHAAELATQATLGAPLRVLKREGSWFWVQTPDGYLGWVDEGGLCLMDKTRFETWQKAEKVVYLPEMGFARATPTADGAIVSDLLAGNILINKGKQGKFVEVGFPDGRSAFVPDTEVMAADQWLRSRQPNAGHIIETAEQFMGRPYLWGGTSGKGVDCSGFTKSVFFMNGLMLPRDASQQVHTGVEVPTDSTLINLLPGDLLFFGKAATPTSPEKVTHVALYLGQGRIIHASGAVKIESLRRGEPQFAEDRLRTFLRARRLLDSPGKNGVIWLKDSFYFAN